VNSQVPASKERMTTNIIFPVPHQALYSPMLALLHSITDREEYEKHKKYFFLPLWEYE